MTNQHNPTAENTANGDDNHELTAGTLKDAGASQALEHAVLPVLPLPNGVVLPGMVVTVALESPEAKAVADAALGAEHHLTLVPRLDGDNGTSTYAKVGVVARIETSGELPTGVRALVLRALYRVRLGSAVPAPFENQRAENQGSSVLWISASQLDEGPLTDSVRQLAAEYRAAAETLLEKQQGGRVTIELNGTDDPRLLADTITYLPDLTLERRVQALELVDVEERFRLVTPWIKEKLAELELKDKIRHEVSEGMEKTQREFLLRQQLTAIRKELGEDATDEASNYREKIEHSALPAGARTLAIKEADRLERMSEQNPEQSWIRNWLDTVLSLPWGSSSVDRLDIAMARSILDTDTTGLREAKDRITEWLAVRKLRVDRASETTVISPEGDVIGTSGSGSNEKPLAKRGEGTTLLLVGPPGVGKTSLGESIARAMGRKFVRVALGGVRDEAEIRGHRRTYVGAKPGRLVDALKVADSMNPVILLDEIDKLGSGWAGDPSAALLEVLDPAQNHTFRDHYLDVDLDLSNVIFIATANSLESIPAPLFDRMELITVDGYIDSEKVAIARNHLVPKQLELHGLRVEDAVLTDATLERIVRGYTREAGVRTLERQIAKVLRKVAVTISQTEADASRNIEIHSEEQLAELLGKPRRLNDAAAITSVPGIANGLAVTGIGGEVLSVETSSMPIVGSSTGLEVHVTGQLGDVMKESASLALSFVRANAAELGVDEKSLDGKRIHVHFPAGATPKDGPSAGITMTTALVSLLTNKPVVATVAMTGELSLAGRVLPIGGVKQKLLAAHRAGLTTVILPQDNEPDLDDVPEHVRKDLHIHLVDDVRKVLRIALAS